MQSVEEQQTQTCQPHPWLTTFHRSLIENHAPCCPGEQLAAQASPRSVPSCPLTRTSRRVRTSSQRLRENSEGCFSLRCASPINHLLSLTKSIWYNRNGSQVAEIQLNRRSRKLFSISQKLHLSWPMVTHTSLLQMSFFPDARIHNFTYHLLIKKQQKMIVHKQTI